MRQEILRELSVDATQPAPTAQQLVFNLSRSAERLVETEPQCISFVLVGGIGFGDFNPKSSDVDTWIIMPDANPADRLNAVQDLNQSFDTSKNELVQTSFLSQGNFRHPPTFLTESESYGYRQAFAAKVGLPVYLGVFPTLSGQPRSGELCFTEEQLVRDLAYSCDVFQRSLLNPPKSELEDMLRYTYKRASYFLRFELAYREGLYVPNQKRLLDECEEHLPEWREAIPVLKKMYEYSYGQAEGTDVSDLQATVRQAMEQNMTQFATEGLIDQQKIEKGNLRSKVFWTLEKTRWDSILLERSAETLRQSMGTGGQRSWGFAFSQINELMLQVSDNISDQEFDSKWRGFAVHHTELLRQLSDESLALYYDTAYQPGLIEFFDRILSHVGELY